MGNQRWKVYDSDSYKCITNTRYNQLINAEKESKLSVWEKISKDTKSYWKKLSDIEEWPDWLVGICFIGGGGLIIFILVLVFSTTCSTKKIKRIEVDGKYGIGYSADELLVPARFDSVSAFSTGNYWCLFDKSTSLLGLAYVNDSIANIIEPKYTLSRRGSGHYAMLLESAPESKYQDKFEYVVYDGRLLNKDPFISIEHIGSIDNPTLFVGNKGYNQKYLLHSDLTAIGDVFESIEVCERDSVIIADVVENYPAESRLYDFKGNRLNNSILYNAQKFSEGTAWGFKEKNDSKNNKWTLFDKSGRSLFSFYGKSYYTPHEFSEGISWIKKNGEDKWTAIDNRGNTKFNIDAESVYPFSMGVAPVIKGKYSNRRLGCVDRHGNTVIPFIYEATYSNPYFASDSTMLVKLNGVEGKLHRNGTFIPNN